MKFGDPSLLPVAIVACGLGLATAGIVTAIWPRRARGISIFPAVIAAAIALGVAALGSNLAIVVVLAAIVSFSVIVSAVRSKRVASAVSIIQSFVQSPRTRWVAIGISGAALSAFGVASIDQSGEFDDAQSLAHLELVSRPATKPVAYAHTDCGSPIALKVNAEERSPQRLDEIEHNLLQDHHWTDHVIRKLPASDESNCHGWVFAGGRYWLDADDVECILSENGYQPVVQARVGDLVIYRDAAGQIMHSGIVRAVLNDGDSLIESKWCWMGVFLHRVGDSDYGANFTYYRSDRGSHLMVGLPTEASQSHSLKTD